MLERTAAKLEPCALPRSLQPAVRPRRKLHTGFWQHGAAAIDLSTQWAYPGHDTQDERPAAASHGLPEQLVASTFLFDFLYPKGTVAFLRRLAPGTADRISRLTSRQHHAALRHFTSTAHSAMLAAESPRLAQDHVTAYHPDHSIKPFTPPEVIGSNALSGSGVSLARLQEIVNPQATRPMSAPELINGLIDRTDTEFFTAVWELWNTMSHEERSPELRKEVIRYLHRSANARDADRVLRLFSEVDVAAWSPSQLNAAVAAHLRKGNLDQAFDIYRNGLEDDRTFVAGMGHLLQWAFRLRDWDLVCRTWEVWRNVESKGPTPGSGSDSKVIFGDLKPLFAIPDLGGHVIELGDFLAKISTTSWDSIATNKSRDDTPPAYAEGTNSLDTSDASSVLRPVPARVHPLLRTLAYLAIRQPCNPERALPLIRLAGNHCYRRYLTLALQQGDTSAVSKVYREYRELSRSKFKPSLFILRGIFNIFRRENDISGLELLYEDWVATHELDQDGQERFLGFYASRGDLRSAQSLWDSYVRDHADKGVLKDPKTFNYLLTAHGNRRNAEMVRQIFNEMTEKYDVQPDIVSWNILLKTLASLGQYDEATETFQQLCSATRPDSVSFGTMIAMCGSRGDIDTALQLWETARKLRVETTVDVVSGIVEAYCLNDRFDEAKAFCIDLSTNQISGDQADLWNCLIKHKGRTRDIAGVEHIIQLMRSRGVEWNRTTDETFLHALARCGKSMQVYQYLCKAADEKRLPVTERLYSTVLHAAWRNRRWPVVTGIYNKMVQAGLDLPAQVRIAAAQAALYVPSSTDQSDVGETGRRANQLGEVFVRHFQELSEAQRQETVHTAGDDDIPQSLRQKGPGGVFNKELYVHKATAILARTRDVASIRRLLDLYRDDLPESPEGVQSLPLPILESMMRADLLENNFGEVRKTWKVVFEKAKERGRAPPGATNRILPRHRQELSRAFSLVHRALVQENDNPAIEALIDEVIDAGFTLSSLQWNYICHWLARKGDWIRACELCEEMLMPGWRGWRSQRMVDPYARNHLTASQKAMGSSTHFLRPNTYMLGFLTDQYFTRRRDALFDETAQRDIARVKATCPKVMFAFRTSLGHSGSGYITQGNFHKRSGRDDM